MGCEPDDDFAWQHGILPPCWQQAGTGCFTHSGKGVCASRNGIPASTKLQMIASTNFIVVIVTLFDFSAKPLLPFICQFLALLSHPAENLLAAEMALVCQSSDEYDARNKIGRRRPLLMPMQVPTPGEQTEQEQRQPATQPFVNRHAGSAVVVGHPKEPAGDGCEGCNGGRVKQRPPRGMAERFALKNSTNKIAGDRHRHQRGSKINQNRMELGRVDEFLESGKNSGTEHGFNRCHADFLTIRFSFEFPHTPTWLVPSMDFSRFCPLAANWPSPSDNKLARRRPWLCCRPSI